MSSKRPPEPRALTSSTAERLAAIVEAAEQAASKVIDDAEEQARRQLSEAGARADRIVAERLRALADELDPPHGGASRASPTCRPVARCRSRRARPARAPALGRRPPARDPDGRLRQQPRGDRRAAAQRLRDRGHQRDTRRDTRTGGLSHARGPDPDDAPARRRAPHPHGNMRLLDRRPDRRDRRPGDRRRRDRRQRRQAARPRP